ncbi:hypothetical protein M0802_013353 [Mischocyttarus mexicanus]|nr:hypothetical protein M0802_013353 [Mischocyttarus mexicanus]
MLSIALNTVAHSTSSWCLDSSETRHISNDKNTFVNLDTNNTPIYTATEDCTQTSGSGVVKFETLGLKNECPQWFKHGYKVELNKRGAVVRRQDGKTIMKATLKDGPIICFHEEWHDPFFNRNNRWMFLIEMTGGISASQTALTSMPYFTIFAGL